MAPPTGLQALTLESLTQDDEGAEESMPAGVTPPGGLTALDIPGAQEAMERLVKSSEQARAALQRAREQVAARKHNRATALLAISGALGSPTRTGAFGETVGNVSKALIEPLQEREKFNRERENELTKIDLNLAGLDKDTAQSELSLAALRAKMANDLRKVSNQVTVEDGRRIYRPPWEASGREAYVQPPNKIDLDLRTQQDFWSKFGQELAPDYKNQYMAAMKAPANVREMRRLRDVIDTEPYMGTGATWKLAVGKAAKALGFDYAKDDIKNTEMLTAGLGNLTLKSIKDAGLGTGQGFTDKDLKFLENAVMGRITFDKESLKEMLRIRENVERATVKQWNELAGGLNPARLKELAVRPVIEFDIPPFEQATPTPAAPPSQPAVAVPPPQSAPPRKPVAPAVTEEVMADDESVNPDDIAVARAPPEALEYLRLHPETKDQFVQEFGYDPDTE